MQTVGADAILRAIDIALDWRKLVLALGGLLTVVFAGGLLGYLSAVVGESEETIGLIFLILAAVVVWFLLIFFSGALTHMSWQEISHNRKPDPAEALAFSWQHIISFLFAPIILVLTGVGVITAEVIILLLGRIDEVGELLVGLLFLPLVIINVLLVIGLIVGGWLVFPIIADSRANPVQTVRRVVEIVRHSPGRLLTYFILALLVIVLTLSILWPLLWLGRTQTMILMQAGVGEDKMADITSSSAVALLASPEFLLNDPEDIFFWLLGGSSFNDDTTLKIAGFLIGLSGLVLLLGAFYLFPWVFTLTLSCAMYASLKTAVPAAASSSSGWVPAPYTPMPTPVPTPTPAAFPAAPSPTHYIPPTPAVPAPYQSPPPAAPNCQSCGKPINTASRFCPFCGTPRTP
jgi:hypothetical protein